MGATGPQNRPRPPRSARAETGLSLVELLVASALSLVVMAAVYGIWGGLDRTFRFTNDDLIAQQQARDALGEMVEYIRTARVPIDPPTEYRNAVISYAGPYSIELWSDIDRDGGHVPDLTRFRVFPNPLDAALPAGTSFTLVREWGDNASGDFDESTVQVRLVTRNVGNDTGHALFSYADSAGDVIPFDAVDAQGFPIVTDPTEIREVRVDLRVDIYTDEAPATHVLSSIVQPRNLRQY